MNKIDQAFTKTVWEWYAANGRHGLPWRQTTDPYCILVSEIMLQQTQVDRVIPKYEAFLRQFPTVAQLAAAPLATVLVQWQGLGYNRRAKYLHDCAKVVVAEYAGHFPQCEATLRSLPGIGPYTAGAMLAFAFDRGVPIIETNIRTVFIHHYFSQVSLVADKAILAVVTRTLPESAVREWYYALMDYGSFLKRSGMGQLHKSVHYKKQTVFAGSRRQLRGGIIRILTTQHRASKNDLQTKLRDFSGAQLETQLQQLIVEGLIVLSGRRYHLAT